MWPFDKSTSQSGKAEGMSRKTVATGGLEVSALFIPNSPFSRLRPPLFRTTYSYPLIETADAICKLPNVKLDKAIRARTHKLIVGIGSEAAGNKVSMEFQKLSSCRIFSHNKGEKVRKKMHFGYHLKVYFTASRVF